MCQVLDFRSDVTFLIFPLNVGEMQGRKFAERTFWGGVQQLVADWMRLILNYIADPGAGVLAFIAAKPYLLKSLEQFCESIFFLLVRN